MNEGTMSSVNIQDILKLPIEERIEIVEAIWDSMAASPESLPVTESQRRELDHRLAAYRANPGLGRTWEEIRESLAEAK